MAAHGPTGLGAWSPRGLVRGFLVAPAWGMPLAAPSSLGRWTGGCRLPLGLSLSPEWVTGSPGVQRSGLGLGGS